MTAGGRNMSLIERGTAIAGWYPDQSGVEQLRWWDGQQWSSEVRPLVIDMIPDFVAVKPELATIRAALRAVETGPAPVVPLDDADVVPVYHGDFTSRLALAPERLAPAPTSADAPLTRRQLREMLGGPLTTSPLSRATDWDRPMSGTSHD